VSAAFLKLPDAGNRRRGWEGGKLPADRARRREKDNLAKMRIEPGDERTSQIIIFGSISGLNLYITAGMAYSCSKAAASTLV
jgi:NAD(P)-dependent dehydrogenase (short-subunit alcohol dehydrogenase family)